MDVSESIAAAKQAAEFVEQHRTLFITGAGVLTVTLSALGYWVRKRLKGKAGLFGRFCDSAAVLVAVGLSAEGMWEAATEQLKLGPEQAILLFAFAELAMLRAARRARGKVDKAKRPGIYGYMVWGIALGAGLIATSNAPNMTEHLIRFGAPLLVAWQWWADLVDDLREKLGNATQESNWIWTPRRIGVRLGWVKPGAVDDLSKMFDQRKVTQLVDVAVAVWTEQQVAKLHGTADRKRPWWRRDRLASASRQLQRLAKTADAQTIRAARQQLQTTLHIEDELFGKRDPVDEQTRNMLDEVRLITRQAADRVRVDHARAFGVDHRVVHGVRMPAHIADQIPDHIPDGWLDRFRTNGRTNSGDQLVDQSSGPAGTAELVQVDQPALDQPASTTAPVDQPATRTVAATSRTNQTQRTTARVDRAKPVSPAAGGEIPPRIQAMVRDLKRAYRGDIPARRAVMDRMEWTSAGDASTAINLVRAERAAKTTDDRTAV